MTSSKPPNVVIILADDMGYADPSCYRDNDSDRFAQFRTPHIDRLAERGIRFTDAHAASAVCTPSRYALLTGEYCWRTRLQQGVLWPYEASLIEPDTPTLATLFGDNGYHCAAVGKWHLGWDWPFRTPPPDGREIPAVEVDVDYSQPIGGGPLDHGFDEFFGFDAPNFPPYCFIDGRHTIGIPDQPSPDSMFGEAGDMVGDWDQVGAADTLIGRAIEIIETRRNKPLFLYLAHPAPHTPIVPTAAWQGRSEIGAYGDFVMQLDDHVGQIVTALERTGQLDNTLIIFSSDNGSPARFDQWEPPGSLTEATGYSPSGPLRGMKGDVWEGGHRVPLVMSWPERMPTGVTNDRLVCLIDAMATLADIIGIESSGRDSTSLLPYLDGDDSTVLRPWLVHHGFDGAYGVRRDRWKLITDRGSGGFSPSPLDGLSMFDARRQEAPPYQLYDLVDDLAEYHNRYGEHPAVVGELATLLAAVRFELPPQRLDIRDDGHVRWETIA